MKKVEYMKENGSWRKSGMHENNIRKTCHFFKNSRFYEYYTQADMLYRICKIDENITTEELLNSDSHTEANK